MLLTVEFSGMKQVQETMAERHLDGEGFYNLENIFADYFQDLLGISCSVDVSFQEIGQEIEKEEVIPEPKNYVKNTEQLQNISVLMEQADYERVLTEMRLVDGTLFPTFLTSMLNKIIKFLRNNL